MNCCSQKNSKTDQLKSDSSLFRIFDLDVEIHTTASFHLINMISSSISQVYEVPCLSDAMV